MPSFRTSLTLSLAVLLAPALGRAADAPPPADATNAELAGQDLDHPPPGAPADQALWRAGHEVTHAVHVERARSTRLQAVLVSLRYVERVDALAARAGEDGEHGGEVQKQLAEGRAAQYAGLTARWPIDTYRVCSAPSTEFASMLLYGKSDPADLAKHRAMLTGCVEQARASVKVMKDGNDALEAAMRRADPVLVAAGLPGPSGAAAPVAVASTPARATPAAHDEAREHARGGHGDDAPGREARAEKHEHHHDGER